MLRTKKEVDRHVRELLNKTKCENDRRAKGYNIARLYFNVGEYEGARRYLAEFVSFRPKSPEAHKLMGQIYEKLGQKEKAVNSFKTSYSISDTQKDLVPKICELYAELDVDPGVSSHWADEGERLFPHHNSIVKLRQSLTLANPSKSKEETEKSFLGALSKSPLSLDLHVKLAKLYIEWGKEQEDKFEVAFEYVWKVETRRPFPHSLEWYQTMVEVFKAYENRKKPKDDKVFEELYLTILDRYVFESIASSCGSALSALCSPREAAMRLQEFDERLVCALNILDKNSDCAKHMIAQYYFHLALLLAIFGRTESILHKDIYFGCLLLHACFLPSKLSKPSFSKEDKSEIFKSHLFTLGHYRVSQTGHLLNKLAHAYRERKYLLNKIQEMCNNAETKKHIHKLIFDSPSEVASKSYLFLDEGFLKDQSKFVDEKVQLLCDQELSLSCNHELRELVWLFIQYSSPNSSKSSTRFLNFLFFRRIPFASSLNTFAPETLCHLDLISFIVAAAYCHQENTDSYIDVGTSCPSILAAHLHTPEQGEWWNAVSVLCLNERSKHLNRLRSVLQNGLESIRHLGHHILPLQVTVYLARYFTSCIQEARDEGNSASEIESLEERAEHYWSKVVAQIFKSSRGTLGPMMKSRLFEIRRCELNESELNEIGEEGELFIADRMVHKGKRDEALQILSRLKSPKASFNRAMLYKKEAQSLLGNRTWYSLNVSSRNEYTSLLTQSRDALYLTLDRLKMPGVDPSDPLNLVLSDELTSIEHSLATVTMDDGSDIEPMDTLAVNPSLPLNLTNGNASTPDAWGGQPFALSGTMFSTPISASRIQRQEARPSPERLDAQVRHLTEIQQNTIKNIEEHNAALRAQNETLLQTCQTMAAQFKENVAFYKSYIEDKNSSNDLLNPVLDQMKQLQISIKNLQHDVRNISTEITELKNTRIPPSKAEPLHLVTGTSAADTQVPLDMASPAMQGVYSNYMGFYGQQPVGSPLVATAAMFNPCQPPFMPPSTLPDQSYLPAASITMKSDHASVLSATTLYQHGLKVNQNKMDKDMITTTVPPHSYQISLPSSSVMSFPSMSQSFPLSSSSDQAFNTEGLLSNVPAPLYSAITTYQSPEKGNKNLLVSSLTSTPVTHKMDLKGGESNFSPIFGQWPNSGADFPGSSTKPVRIPSGDAKSPNKSANESDHYVEDEHDPCPDFKPIIPLPEQVEVNTGEENEKVLFEGRAKLFRFVDKEWKERGLGPLKVLHNESQNTVRVLMRRDQTHKICCNHLISSTMELSPMKDNDKAWLWAAQDFADEKLTVEKFCCRFKTGEAAQDFQKAFNKGKIIAEESEKNKNDTSVTDIIYPSDLDVTPATTVTPTTKPSEMKSLQEMFKPEEGSWSCSICLIKNKKDVTACVACMTPRPGEMNAKWTADSSSIKETPKVKFRFGVSNTSSQSTSPSNTLTFLDDKSSAKTVLSFGTPVSKQGIVFGTPLSSSTVSSSTSIFSTSGGASLTFGPSSSVTINAVKPGSSPSISIFKTNSVESPTAIVISADALKENISPAKSEGGGKFSMEGFTFSSQPTLTSPIPLVGTEIKLTERAEPKKDSIFSNFTFSSSKPSADSGSQGSILFNLPVSTAATSSTTQESATSTQSSGGGSLWSTKNTENAFSFSSLAASDKGDSNLFSTRDPKAFEPKPLFGKTGSLDTKKNDSATADVSKDEIEEYEPQVEFKPVVPLPDLIEVKTGEEEEEQLFCERAKLFRYDQENKEWKERGVGEAKLLKNISSSKIRFLMRRDQTHKVCANHFLTKDMVITPMANSDKAWVWGAHDFADEEMKMEKFAIRFKLVESASKFKTVFEDAQKVLPTSGLKDEEENSAITASEKVSEISKDTKSLSELFKPSLGSWECSVCLVRNPSDSTSCLACSTPKDGETAAVSSSTGSSVFGSSSAFAFKSSSSGSAFSFGIPSKTETSTTSGFSFGIPSSTNATINSNTTSVASTTSKPITFTWKPPVATEISSVTTSTTTTTTTVPTTPVKSSPSATSGFTFGSPGKYKFEFSGVKSPRSRDTSTCESEGAEEEEEEDNLYFEPVIPLPDKVDVITGEEDENVLFSHRAKLFRIKDGEFKERGLGDIKLLDHKLSGKIRLLMRREQVHKICLNHYLNKDLQFLPKDEKSLCWVATDFSEQEPVKETFAIRFKTSDVTNSFLAAIHEAQIKLGRDPSTLSNVTSTVASSTTTTTATTTVTESKTSTPIFGVFGKTTATTTTQPTMFSFGDRASLTTKDEDLEIIYEKKATPAQIEAAKKLLLPDNFYLYEDKKPCPGCIGCSPDEFVFKEIEKNLSSAKEIQSLMKTNIFGGVTTTPSNLFTPKVSTIQTPSTPTNIFGGVSSFSSDANSKTPVFGSSVSTTKSIFDATPTATVSIFGGTPTATGSIFGATPTTTGSIFGGTPTTTGSIFGGTPSSTSIFGGIKSSGTTLPSLFGGVQSTTSSSLGSTSSVGTTGTSLFGTTPSLETTKKSLFGTSTTTEATTGTSLFGSTPSVATTETSLFGGTPSVATTEISLFGGTPAVATTGTPLFEGIPSVATSGTSLFGSVPSEEATKKSLFGTTAPTVATIGTSLFGSAPSLATSGTSLFGNSQPTFGFEGLKPSSVPVEPSLDSKALSNQPSGVGVLSFGDIAKQSPTNTTTFKSTKTDPDVWVSKPLFASALKSPDRDGGDADENYDPHYEPVIPMPDLVTVTTGEEGWTELYSHRAKVYRYDVPLKEWKERGLGDFKIQYEPNMNKYRFLQRRDQVHKLSCNHYITPSLSIGPMSTSETAWCWTATDFSEKPEGETLKLAVRFKTKEIASEFKNAFDSCVEKMNNPPTTTSFLEQGEPQTFAEVSSTTSSFVVIEQPLQEGRDTEEEEEVDYGDDADEYEDISGSETADEEEEEAEDSDDEEQTLIFTDKCQMSVKMDQEWQSRGLCDIKIAYDGDAYGARIVGISDDGEKFVDHLIAIQTTIHNEEDHSVCWTSLDESEHPPKKVEVKATFSNEGGVRRFEAAFEEGKEYAYNSGIEETCNNEVPEELLYYGQASED